MKTGKFSIVKITAITDCSDINSNARLQLCDSKETTLETKDDADHIILDLQKKATSEESIVFDCPEPITVRNGLLPMVTTNLKPGSTLVYIK